MLTLLVRVRCESPIVQKLFSCRMTGRDPALRIHLFSSPVRPSWSSYMCFLSFYIHFPDFFFALFVFKSLPYLNYQVSQVLLG